MIAYGPSRAVPGILYAENGMRLAGKGPDAFTDALPFKAVFHGSPPRSGAGSERHVEDRIWVLPDSFGIPPEFPAQLLLELAGIIRDGGQVGLAVRNRAESVQMGTVNLGAGRLVRWS